MYVFAMEDPNQTVVRQCSNCIALDVGYSVKKKKKILSGSKLWVLIKQVLLMSTTTYVSWRNKKNINTFWAPLFKTNDVVS